MSVLPIRIYGDPILRVPTRKVTEFDENLVNIIDDMIDTMRLEEGIGLAANQVGISKNIMVIDVSQIDERYEPIPFMNLEILEKSGNATAEEGCLSLPGIRENLERAKKIRIRFQDIFGETKESEFEDLLARVIQHENDHLNGILLIDRISAVRKKLLSSRLQKLAKKQGVGKVNIS